MSDEPEDERRILDALRAGDEDAFATLVRRLHQPLVRTAMRYVREEAVAEEVVQDTWIAVVKGIDRFEGRSSLRTWIFRIATFQAKSRGERERRHITLSSLFDDGDGDGGPSVEAERFMDSGRFPGHWSQPPTDWGADVERRLLAGEARSVIEATLTELSEGQRTVMTLRDLDGFTSDEVCEVLDISAGNQRVLLHRARSRVRGALERYVVEASLV